MWFVVLSMRVSPAIGDSFAASSPHQAVRPGLCFLTSDLGNYLTFPFLVYRPSYNSLRTKFYLLRYLLNDISRPFSIKAVSGVFVLLSHRRSGPRSQNTCDEAGVCRHGSGLGLGAVHVRNG